MKLSEKQVQNSISNWLSWNKIPHRRLNSGAFVDNYESKKTGVIKTRFFNFIKWLWPKDDTLKTLDLCGWHKGKYFEVEIKATGKKPSKDQEKTIAFLNDLGIISFWADSLEMFIYKWTERDKGEKSFYTYRYDEAEAKVYNAFCEPIVELAWKEFMWADC